MYLFILFIYLFIYIYFLFSFSFYYYYYYYYIFFVVVVVIELLPDEEDELMLSALWRGEQRGGNPLFRAEFTRVGRNRSFRGILEQRKFRLTLQQLRSPDDGELLGEAMSESIIQGLQSVVENEGINIEEYSLLVAVHSNSFANVWSQSARHVPLTDWLNNAEYTRAWLDDLAKKLNSAEVVEPERDGFYVELTFVKRLGRGAGKKGKQKNPGRYAWETMAKKTRCVIPIKNNHHLCLARAVVTMKERADKGSQYQNLRKGRPIQERLAKQLHRDTNVPERPCGLPELRAFQDYLGKQGYQLIVVEPSKCLIVFKDPAYNAAPHFIGLVKYQDHYDGLTSIPALLNRSYYCRLCDRGYDQEDSAHHNCFGQNCPACLRNNKTCPNFAAWIKPTIECQQCYCKFYGQDCIDAHKKKSKEETSICESWKKCLICSAEYHFDPKNKHKCYHVSCTNCGEFKHVDHRCYIQPIVEKPPQEQQQDPLEDPLHFQFEADDDGDENRGPPPPPVLNFADIECYLTKDRVFVPNWICWSSEEDGDFVHHSDSIDEFLESLQSMTEVEDDERPRKVITFFHNMRGFDGNFILEALYDQGRSVERPLTQGAKILYFESGELIFKDSMNFFAMPLAKFPSTFNLQEIHKGFFPHSFNRQENFRYEGAYPPAADYNPDEMDSKKRAQFLTWHAQKVASNAVFNF